MNFPTNAIIFSLFFCAASAGICMSRPKTAQSDTMPQQKVNSRTFYAENPLDDAIAYIHQTRRDNNASKATNNHAYQQPADPVAYAKQNQMRQPAGTKANIPNSGIKFPSPGHRRSPVHAGGSNRTRGKKPLLAHQKAQKNRALLMNSPPPLPSAEAVLHQSRQHAENNQSQRARHNSTKKIFDMATTTRVLPLSPPLTASSPSAHRRRKQQNWQMEGISKNSGSNNGLNVVWEEKELDVDHHRQQKIKKAHKNAEIASTPSSWVGTGANNSTLQRREENVLEDNRARLASTSRRVGTGANNSTLQRREENVLEDNRARLASTSRRVVGTGANGINQLRQKGLVSQQQQQHEQMKNAYKNARIASSAHRVGTGANSTLQRGEENVWEDNRARMASTSRRVGTGANGIDQLGHKGLGQQPKHEPMNNTYQNARIASKSRNIGTDANGMDEHREQNGLEEQHQQQQKMDVHNGEMASNGETASNPETTSNPETASNGGLERNDSNGMDQIWEQMESENRMDKLWEEMESKSESKAKNNKVKQTVGKKWKAKINNFKIV